MKLSKNYNSNISTIDELLHINESFDLLKKEFMIGSKHITLYFIDGFLKDDNLESLINSLSVFKKQKFSKSYSACEILKTCITSCEAVLEDDFTNLINSILSGQTAIIIENIQKALLIDYRTYPARGPEEPDSEKVLRGSRDGFVETIVSNTALIRRRIRDTNLRIEMINIGEISKSDIAICYMKDTVDKKALKILKEKINNINIKSLTLGGHTLIEYFSRGKWYNPMPIIRYSERPDTTTSHILEGRIAIFVDNNPSALLLPGSIFDFLQNVDDYYSPLLTGNYLRILRNLVLLSTLLFTPLYLLFTRYYYVFPSNLYFLLPTDEINIPIVFQFLILELAVDSLRTASLNTPNALSMSLSVVGAIILGEYAVSTGWFIPQCVFYMAIVALASYTETNIEIGYAIKFFRMFLLICTAIFGLPGFIISLIISFIIVLNTKTLTGYPYLYPLIPFNYRELCHALFRVNIKGTRNINR